MPQPDPLEADVEKRFILRVKQLGGRAYKFRSPANRGVTDRIAVLPDGTVWFVELKRLNGVMSELQKLHRDDLQGLRANHATLYGMPGVESWFEKRKAELKPTPFQAAMAARPQGAR